MQDSGLKKEDIDGIAVGGPIVHQRVCEILGINPVWGIEGAMSDLLIPQAVPVQTAAVVTSTPSQQFVQLTASGYVVAQRRASVASKATGRLIELNVREGSVVKQGAVIARLDASDVRAAIVAAQASVRQAEAGVRQAEVELANADADLARSKGLQAQGFISPQAVDASQTRANAARAALASAKAGLEVAQAQVKVQRVAEDFSRQHLLDQKLPEQEKRQFTLVMGMRCWLFERFAHR